MRVRVAAHVDTKHDIEDKPAHALLAARREEPARIRQQDGRGAQRAWLGSVVRVRVRVRVRAKLRVRLS